MIDRKRISSLNNNKIKDGDYVLYWMQASQRTEYNHALEHAIDEANLLDQPLLVLFTLTDNFPEANARHYHFMLEGLQEVEESLNERGIKMITLQQSPPEAVVRLAHNASLVVVDRDYLRPTRVWREDVASRIDCHLFQVETNITVPVDEASDKEEYAAYTIRKKINSKVDYFLNPVEHQELNNPSLDLTVNQLLPGETTFPEGRLIDLSSPLEQIIAQLEIDQSVKKVKAFTGGTSQAKKRLQIFLEDKLDDYSEKSSDPNIDCVSHLSPYIHFGQISPAYIARKVKETESPGKEDFLEQLIVRRELSINFVYYNQDYDSSLKDILPEWAYQTLKEHKNDEREFLYSLKELENANTHDKYWNAAHLQMVQTGKMHNYMRMYWGKKILEWTKTPQQGFEFALYLNNKYSLDGRDPNTYAGIAWIFGKHDRAWAERDIFGKVRYMNANGLQRKFDPDSYAEKFLD